jgi:hypothetical protein
MKICIYFIISTVRAVSPKGGIVDAPPLYLAETDGRHILVEVNGRFYCLPLPHEEAAFVPVAPNETIAAPYSHSTLTAAFEAASQGLLYWATSYAKSIAADPDYFAELCHDVAEQLFDMLANLKAGEKLLFSEASEAAMINMDYTITGLKSKIRWYVALTTFWCRLNSELILKTP